MPPAKVHVSIPSAYYERLQRIAAGAGLPIDDYAAGVLIQHVLNDGVAITPKRAIGRPLGPLHVDDIPESVERSANASGFVGVTKYGRAWQAKAGSEVIGKFSSPELAATVRHYAFLGFYVGRGAFFRSVGVDAATAVQNAMRAYFGPLTPAAEEGARAAVDGSYDKAFKTAISGAAPPRRARSTGAPNPPSGESESSDDDDWDDERFPGPRLASQGDGPSAGPATTEEPRATPAIGGRAPSTSTDSIARSEAARQVDFVPGRRVHVSQQRARCPVCGGEMNKDVARKHVHLCLLCSDDFDVWQKMPARDDPSKDPPTDGVYVSNPYGTTASESFKEYVARTRAL